jgi:hypothetical protein
MNEYAAQLVNNIVEQIIVGNYVWANENLGGVWVDCTDDGDLTISIGYIYDPITGTFTAPPPPPVPDVPPTT